MKLILEHAQFAISFSSFSSIAFLHLTIAPYEHLTKSCKIKSFDEFLSMTVSDFF